MSRVDAARKAAKFFGVPFEVRPEDMLADYLEREASAPGSNSKAPAVIEPEPTPALSFRELRELEKQSRQMPMLVQDMFPMRGISVAAGDSTIGKSALILQLAACVAGGKPFLGKQTQRGTVLVVDWENGDKIAGILENVAKVAGVSEADLEENITVLKSPTPEEVFEHVAKLKPALVTLDALRWLLGGREAKTEVVQERFAQMMDAGSSWLLVHHLRKQDREAKAPPLEDPDTRVVQWFQEVSGSIAITNQSFTRMGVVEPKKGGDLMLRWVVKLQGERGPLHVERVFEDDDPERPLGYQLALGERLLSESDMTRFILLAGKVDMTFQDVADVFKGNKSTASRLLRTLEQVGVCDVRKNGRAKLYTFAKSGSVSGAQIAAAQTAGFQPEMTVF